MSESDTPAGYQIGDLVLDLGTQEIRRGDEILAVPALSFHTLVALARSAPNLLTVDDLIEQVWNGRIVSNETVTQRIKLIRQAIDDDAQNPTYIGSVRAGGYRMIAPVRPIPTFHSIDSVAPRQARRWRAVVPASVILAMLVGGVAFWLAKSERIEPSLDPSTRIVALLPFVTREGGTDLERLSGALNDELRDSLRALGVKIVARGSVMAIDRSSQPTADIAGSLGAELLIEGELASSDGGVNLHVAIVDGASGIELWGERFVTTASGLPQLHQEIVRAVGQELGVDLTDRNLTPASDDPAAYDLILLARHFEQNLRDRWSVDFATLDRAIELYEQATQIDPDSALAHSRLGAALLFRGDVHGARGPIFKAFDLEPNLADVQYTLGLYYWHTQNDLGGDAFARAVEINPNHPEALAAHAKWIWHQQDFDQPGYWFERARDVDPLTLERYSDLGTFYSYQNNKAATLDIAQQINARFATPEAFEIIARLYELVGALDLAIAWAWRGRLVAAQNVPDPTWQLAELYGRIGLHTKANELVPKASISKLFWQRRYQELIDIAEEAIIERPDDAKIYYQLAFAYSTQNQHAAAVRILRLAGLPDSAYADSRRADAVEAMATYAASLRQIGETTEATTVAAWLRDRMQIARLSKAEQSWWPNLYQACAYMNLDASELALERLSAIGASHALAWEPVLRDAACFRPLQSNPTYLAVLTQQMERKQHLRDALPASLARFNIAP